MVLVCSRINSKEKEKEKKFRVHIAVNANARAARARNTHGVNTEIDRGDNSARAPARARRSRHLSVAGRALCEAES